MLLNALSIDIKNLPYVAFKSIIKKILIKASVYNVEDLYILGIAFIYFGNYVHEMYFSDSKVLYSMFCRLISVVDY